MAADDATKSTTGGASAPLQANDDLEASIERVAEAELAIRGLTPIMNAMSPPMQSYAALLNEQAAAIRLGTKNGRGAAAILAANLHMTRELTPLIEEMDGTVAAFVDEVERIYPIVELALNLLDDSDELKMNARQFLVLASLGAIAMDGQIPLDVPDYLPPDRTDEPPNLRKLNRRFDATVAARQQAIKKMNLIHERSTEMLYQIDGAGDK